MQRSRHPPREYCSAGDIRSMSQADLVSLDGHGNRLLRDRRHKRLCPHHQNTNIISRLVERARDRQRQRAGERMEKYQNKAGGTDGTKSDEG